MKKGIIILGIVLLILAGIGINYFSRPSLLELASKAEAHGNYAEALDHFVSVACAKSESLPYPEKEKAVTTSETDWKKSVESYLSWIIYPVMQPSAEFGQAISGIVRCTSFVEKANFLTEKAPKPLVRDSLFEQWREPFFRERKNDFRELDDCINRAMKDTVSVLRIRAMNGYIYRVKLIDILTGKATDFVLYPNTSISLLIKPRRYFCICSSEVQFTEGLAGRTWHSPQNVIPIVGPSQTSLWQVTLRTRVTRSQ